MRTINYKVSYEKLISRLPGLFAFVYVDEQGSTEIVKATRGKQGNYGQIVANIDLAKVESETLPYIDSEDEYVFSYDCEDGSALRVKRQEYSYRTLIDIYYKAINDAGWDGDDDGTYIEPFLAFMERGIGLKYVGLSEEDSDQTKCGVNVKNTYPLAPDYIYLGEAKTMCNQMIKLKKQIEFYEKHTASCKEDMKRYNQLNEKYELMNGDKLITVLRSFIQEAEDVAEEYLEYASETNLTLDFNINLYNTIKDLGMVTPYIEEWVAGKRHYNGDVVYHEDDNGYGLTWKCNIDENSENVKSDEYGRYYTEGYYDSKSELVYFEDGHTIESLGLTLPTNWVAQSLNWVERNEEYDENGEIYYRYAFDEETSTSKASEQVDSQVISGTCNSHLAGFRRFRTYTDKNDNAEYPEGFKDWLWYYRVGMIFNREEKYDELGNLAVMYGTTTTEEPKSFYAEGVEEITNNGDSDIGNNIVWDDDNETALNLAVWGDAITNISAENNDDGETGTITFEYYMGAHLIAKKDEDNGDWYSVDDDGNYRYYFKDFEIDTDSVYGKNKGVKYAEAYTYYKGDLSVEVLEEFGDFEPGDIIDDEDYYTYEDELNENMYKWRFLEESIWSLVASGRFDDYVAGNFDSDYQFDDSDDINAAGYYLLYDKLEFDTSDNVRQYDFKVGSRYNQVSYLMTNFEATIDIRHVDFENTPLIRYDYYNGVSFQPSANDDVNIERGVTQAFEKYIKFGEVKTLEDIENFANGGFFTISEENIDLG